MLRDLITPKSFRGDVVAGGTTVLVIAAGLWEMRVVGEVDPIVRTLVLGLCWIYVLTLALRSEPHDEQPRVYQSVLYVEALLLAGLTFAAFASVIWDDGWLAGRDAKAVVLALLTVHAAWLSRTRNSAVCTLLAAAGFAATAPTALLWAFGDDQIGAARWLLLVISLGYVLKAVRWHTDQPAHALAYAEAAGLALVGLAVTWTGMLLPLPGGGGGLPIPGLEVSAASPAFGWTIVILCAGLGLIGYGGVQRERGPAWIGALLLLHFCVLEQDGGFWGWPLVLVLVAGLLLVAGLRPSTPAPPEPDSGLPPSDPVHFPRLRKER